MTDNNQPSPEEIIADTLREIEHEKTFSTFEQLINLKHAEAVAAKKAEREILRAAGVPVSEYDAISEDYLLEINKERMLAEARRSADKLCGGPLDQSNSMYRYKKEK